MVKDLLYKCEDLSSDPQKPCKKLIVVSCASNLRIGKTGGKDQ